MGLSDFVCVLPRALVSQNKRRFTEGGFDLDLTYIHPRIIVMGYPSAGLERWYRNPRSEVVRLLETRHASHYFVYNFCDERNRCYPASDFDGRVKCFPVEDHNVPTLQQAVSFCEDAAAWLSSDPSNVVALHCKAGKGRAGMMACMLLIRMSYAPTAANAIENYNSVRVSDRLGLTVHSQKKWVRYYEDLLNISQRAPSRSQPGSVCESDISEPSIMIERLSLRNMLTGVMPPELRLRVFQLDGSTTAKTMVCEEQGRDSFDIKREVRGCVLLEFYRLNDCRPKKHFKIWFNTLLLKSTVIMADNHSRRCSAVFSRSEMDWVRRDKKMRRFPAAFEVEMSFTAGGEYTDVGSVQIAVEPTNP